MDLSIKKGRIKNNEIAVPEKKQIGSLQSEESTESIALNDDCIFKILDFLTLKDLCSTKEVNKRLCVLATSQFEREYHTKWMYLTLCVDWNDLFWLMENYVLKSFKKNFRSILAKSERELKLFFSLRAEYRRIQFDGMFLESAFFGDDIRKHLKSIAFNNCWNFQRLELRFVGSRWTKELIENIEKLKALKQFTGIHFHTPFTNPNPFRAITLLDNLQTLSVCRGLFRPWENVGCFHLPSLQELYLTNQESFLSEVCSDIFVCFLLSPVEENRHGKHIWTNRWLSIHSETVWPPQDAQKHSETEHLYFLAHV